MAKYYVIDGLSLEAGPQLGYLLNVKIIDQGTYHGKTYLDSWHYDLSLNFGASYQLPNNLFGFSARYSFGLTKTVSYSYYGGSGKNRIFQFGVFVNL
jgi:hypothetical protein